jgi:hypothetical protein
MMHRNTMLLTVVLSVAGCSGGRDAAPPAADSAVARAAPRLSAIPTLPKVGPVAIDSGPPVRLDRTAQGGRVVMLPDSGDQINALQPPVLTTRNGRRLAFRGAAVTNDSAYFVGEVMLPLVPDDLPLEGTLVTSYCRSGEKLCRTARRVVRFTP